MFETAFIFHGVKQHQIVISGSYVQLACEGLRLTGHRQIDRSDGCCASVNEIAKKD